MTEVMAFQAYDDIYMYYNFANMNLMLHCKRRNFSKELNFASFMIAIFSLYKNMLLEELFLAKNGY